MENGEKYTQEWESGVLRALKRRERNAEGHINFLGHAWVSPNTGEKSEMAHSVLTTCERIHSFHV